MPKIYLLIGTLFGGGGLLYGLIRQLRLLKYPKIDALCIEVEYGYCKTVHGCQKGSKVTYQYSFEGKTYIYRESKFWSSPKMTQGLQCKVRIQPDNPDICYPPYYSKDNIIYICTGSLIVILGLLLLIFH